MGDSIQTQMEQSKVVTETLNKLIDKIAELGPISWIEPSLIEAGAAVMLMGMGEDIREEELKDTPNRIARMYSKLLRHPEQRLPEETIKPLPKRNMPSTDIVCVHNVPFYSFCRHHLALFYGTFSIGYVPQGKLLGLSKLIRLFRFHSKQLTLQEQLTENVANDLFGQDELNPKGVIVHVVAEHTCVSVRGVRALGAKTTTVSRRGDFAKDVSLCNIFFEIVKGGYDK